MSKPSKTRSGARRVKLREPFEYFVDRSLGREVVVQALRAVGEIAHAHDDLFPQTTPDEVWLTEVGRRRWVVVTKDKNIRHNQIEHVALVRARVACFMLGRGDLTALSMAAIFVAALPRIRRVLRRFDVPVAASLGVGGTMKVLLADGVWLKPPKEIK